jgi:hypothetical protein
MNSSPLSPPISTAAYPIEFHQLLRKTTENFVDRKFVFSATSHFLNSHSDFQKAKRERDAKRPIFKEVNLRITEYLEQGMA